MKKLVALFAICMCLLACVAFSSCDSSDCDHPNSKVTHNYFMSEDGNGHNSFCNECHTDLGWERCDTPDGKCGKCSVCDYESEHQYSTTGKKDEETHEVNCFRCKDTTSVPHDFSPLGHLTYIHPTEHDITMHCYQCGVETREIGDHSSLSNEWKTSETDHWKSCDVCNGEFAYELHNLVDGTCTSCGYEAAALPVTEYLTFELSEDETYYVVTGMQKDKLEYGCSFSLVIPETYNDKPVKEIGQKAFWNYYSDGYNILSVYIPDSVVKIGAEAFYYCVKLADVKLPSTLESIENDAFYNCAIVDLTIPSKAMVASSAFANNKYLMTLEVKEGVKEIGEFAFTGCYNLESISLPSTIEILEASVFENCDNIKTITVDEKNDKFVSVDNCLMSISDRKLLRSNANMTIPSQVKILSKYALSCDNSYYIANEEFLVKHDVVLPLGIESIEYGALSYSTVNTVNFQNSSGNNGTYVAGGNYLYEKANAILVWGNGACVIPSSINEIAEKAFSHCTFVGDFVIPANIKKVAYNAFFNCFFDSVTIEDGVEEIMFIGCSTKQKELTIPGSIKIVSNGEYYDANFGLRGLEKVILAEGIEGIDVYFSCEVVYPSTLNYVGVRVFRAEANVTEYEGCKYLGNASNPYLILLCAVNRNDKIAVKVHKDTKIIAANAFSGGKVTSLVFEGDSIESICDNAFRYAFGEYAGNTIVLPNSVKRLGNYAFEDEYCSDAFGLVLGEGIEYIGCNVVAYRGFQTNSITWVGAVGYLGNSRNPYLAVVAMDPFKVDGYQGWGEVDCVISSQTEMLATSVIHWNTLRYEGTMSQFKELILAKQFIEKLNELEGRAIVCTDGTIVNID